MTSKPSIFYIDPNDRNDPVVNRRNWQKMQLIINKLIDMIKGVLYTVVIDDASTEITLPESFGEFVPLTTSVSINNQPLLSKTDYSDDVDDPTAGVLGWEYEEQKDTDGRWNKIVLRDGPPFGSIVAIHYAKR